MSQRDDGRFAADEGVHTLYKFRAFRTENERRWVREILLDHKLYFSRSDQLNDSHDLRPLIEFRPAATERELRAMLRADAEISWGRQKPPLSMNLGIQCL
jgi:hypothetical protein